MIRRAHRNCSSWELFHSKILNIKQLLVNNGFSNNNIEEEISTFLSNPIQEHNPQIRNKSEVFYKKQMSDAHETDGKDSKENSQI